MMQAARRFKSETGAHLPIEPGALDVLAANRPDVESTA
jgi:hypothetical protein